MKSREPGQPGRGSLPFCSGQGCSWNKLAVRRGHLAVLQWAGAEGCPWDADTCSHAGPGGHLEVLQWARAHGCMWDESTCAAAGWVIWWWAKGGSGRWSKVYPGTRKHAHKPQDTILRPCRSMAAPVHPCLKVPRHSVSSMASQSNCCVHHRV